MTKRTTLFVLACVLIAASSASTATAATPLPCFLTQIQVSDQPDLTVASGTAVYAVVVSGIPSFRSNCPASDNFDIKTGSISVPINYVVEKWNAMSGTYEPFLPNISAVFPLDGKQIRRQLQTIYLPEGSYRLGSDNGTSFRDFFLEYLPFAVGSIATDFAPLSLFSGSTARDDRSRLPYGQPSAIFRDGAFYFRGFLRAKWISGYLYQDQGDKTVILPADFEQVDPSDGGFTALPQFAGDATDPGWVRVALGSDVGFGTFDAGRRVYACPTANLGGATTCFPIFDPNILYRDFNPNATPFGVSTR